MQTIVEDHETNLQSAIAGDRIAYCRDALVYDEFTENFGESFNQRIRWTYGMIQCMRRYEGRLLRQALRGSLQCFDIAMVNIMPAVIPASLLGMVSGFFIAEPAMGYPMLAVWMLCIGWTGFMLGALIALAKSGSRISSCVPGIAGFPLFMLSWIAVFVICLFKKDISWTPVRHTRAITIEEVDPTINKRD
jgi:cellulose synthase/poly-beta-1,6-N-acetylglucosamine synthase-like glycosyltransferase